MKRHRPKKFSLASDVVTLFLYAVMAGISISAFIDELIKDKLGLALSSLALTATWTFCFNLRWKRFQDILETEEYGREFQKGLIRGNRVTGDIAGRDIHKGKQ